MCVVRKFGRATINQVYKNVSPFDTMATLFQMSRDLAPKTVVFDAAYPFLSGDRYGTRIKDRTGVVSRLSARL
jgi:hypothetical protein